MRRIPTIGPMLGILLLGAIPAQDEPPTLPPSVRAALDKATARAKVHNKRVLVVFADAGDDVLREMKRVPGLSRKLLYECEVVQLQGGEASAAARVLGFDDAVSHRPSALVLDGRSKELARFPSSELTDDGVLRGKEFAAKLEKLYCPPVDAEKKLRDALAEARKSGRNVFIRFDAPW